MPACRADCRGPYRVPRPLWPMIAATVGKSTCSLSAAAPRRDEAVGRNVGPSPRGQPPRRDCGSPGPCSGARFSLKDRSGVLSPSSYWALSCRICLAHTALSRRHQPHLAAPSACNRRPAGQCRQHTLAPVESHTPRRALPVLQQGRHDASAHRCRARSASRGVPCRFPPGNPLGAIGCVTNHGGQLGVDPRGIGDLAVAQA